MGIPSHGSATGPKRFPVTHARAVPKSHALGLGDLIALEHFEVTDEELHEASNVTALSSYQDYKWDEFTSGMMHESCAFFAHEVLTGPSHAPYNGRFLIGEHHQEWDDLVADYDRICVLAPRDHGKSFFFNFAFPIHQAYYNPRGKGFIFSSTKPQAERILQDIREEIENNPKLQWLVPEKKEQWSNSQIKLSNGHVIYARGFGTRVRGAHPNWIVVDDGLNDETAYSEVVRSKQIDYFFQAITNMIVPGGQIIVVGTPFHQADLYAELEQNEEYEFRRYQAWNEETETVLWPDRYDKDLVLRRKREIGPIRFNREFQCIPIADEMSLFPGWLFKGEHVELFNVKLGMPIKWWAEAGITSTYMGVDIALSAETGADFMVIWVVGLDKYGNRYILEIERHKGLGYQHQLSHINRLARLYKCGLVYIEANQMQRVWGDELIRLTDLPIQQFVTSANNKNALDKGVPSLRVLLENGKFKIPRGDVRSIELTDIWINEMRAFTWHDGKLESVGSHDDTVMACWICDQACRMGAFSFTFGDEEGMAMTQEELDAELGVDGKGDQGEDGGDSGNGKASGNLVGDEEARVLGLPITDQLR